jgi:hypothetical protein
MQFDIGPRRWICLSTGSSAQGLNTEGVRKRWGATQGREKAMGGDALRRDSLRCGSLRLAICGGIAGLVRPGFRRDPGPGTGTGAPSPTFSGMRLCLQPTINPQLVWLPQRPPAGRIPLNMGGSCSTTSLKTNFVTKPLSPAPAGQAKQ